MTTTTRLASRAASPDWEYALCAQTDPDLFFPDGVGAQISTATEQAKAICARCPIKDSCLSWALETHQPVGVWGGTDKKDRRLIRKRAARVARAEVRAA